MQAKAQKKKDEAEVQVNLYPMEATQQKNKRSQRPGTVVQIVECLLSREFFACLSGSWNVYGLF